MPETPWVRGPASQACPRVKRWRAYAVRGDRWTKERWPSTRWWQRWQEW